MGKPLIQQRRGKGGPVFTAPSHLFAADVSFRNYDEREKNSVINGEVIGFLNDPSRSGVLMTVLTDEGKIVSLVAPEGISLGERVQFGAKADLRRGNVLPLYAIPDGTPVYNIEITPGDGGKMIRSAGEVGYVVSHVDNKVLISLPSKEVKEFDKNCRAAIGNVSCGGRIERPIFKAGKRYHMLKAKAVYWPKVRGVAMSPYDHPFGGKEHHPGRSTVVSKGTPPGAKIGLIGAGKVGRKRGRKKPE